MAATQERISRTAAIGIALSLAFGIGVAVLRAINAEPVARSAEIAGDVAFAVVFLGPGLLALLGVRGRRSLFLAAGFLSLVLAFLGLLSFVGLVFVPQAVLFLVAAGRGGSVGVGPVRSVAAVLVAAVLGTLAFFALFQRDDPVCWATIGSTGQSVRLDASRFVHANSISMSSEDLPAGATASGCASDSISPSEGATAVAVIVVMLVASWFLTRPGQPPRVPAPSPG
jgi:hypothetical protein